MVDILMIGENNLFSGCVLLYSLICLFTFFNITYVRDFDVMQVNIVAILLAVLAINLSIHQEFSYGLSGMTCTLIVDSFYALRS
jgi:hypothetical protein